MRGNLRCASVVDIPGVDIWVWHNKDGQSQLHRVDHMSPLTFGTRSGVSDRRPLASETSMLH